MQFAVVDGRKIDMIMGRMRPRRHSGWLLCLAADEEWRGDAGVGEVDEQLVVGVGQVVTVVVPTEQQGEGEQEGEAEVLVAAGHVDVDVVEVLEAGVGRVAGGVGIGPPALAGPAGGPDLAVIDHRREREAVGVGC